MLSASTAEIAARRVLHQVSASVVNARMLPDPSGEIPVYSYGLAGYVMHPSHNELLCSFHYDAGTMVRRCDDADAPAACVPGCTPRAGVARVPADWDDPFGAKTWCGPCTRGCGRHAGYPCAFAPEHLSWMLTTHQVMRRE